AGPLLVAAGGGSMAIFRYAEHRQLGRAVDIVVALLDAHHLVVYKRVEVHGALLEGRRHPKAIPVGEGIAARHRLAGRGAG
nr:hypothetical protein [Tanacetum cinerariifolium]